MLNNDVGLIDGISGIRGNVCWRGVVEQGVKLYNQHKQQQAVRKWKSALKAIRKREDKFELLGYLYLAYMDWGKYRDALEFAHKQLYISEELDNPNMRAESYLNLARAHQRLGGLERALAYARHSLYNECEQCATAGHVHLTVGSVYLELAGFNKALDSFQHAHRIAQAVHDSSLELQVYVGLSELFSRLQDGDKSAKYASKAYDLSRSLQLGDLNSRHHRAALLQMASALRKQGELGDAQDYCSEATRLALVSGDQATYARSIRIMGDIYRKKCDINKAFRQYETAMGSAAAMGDRVIQMESMDGAARCLEALRLQHKICNCRPLEFNTRLLEVASSVGAKLLVRTVRIRLSRIYHALGDEDQRLHHERVALRLQQDLDMNCGGCGSPYGFERDSLEALPCAHILHARYINMMIFNREKNAKASNYHKILLSFFGEIICSVLNRRLIKDSTITLTHLHSRNVKIEKCQIIPLLLPLILFCLYLLNRCAYEILRGKNKKKKKACPDCDKVSSKLYLNCNDYNNTYSPIPLSICSSDSHCTSHQATSSV
ncbi:43 kda receptor-associated protein of the synapse [Holotrichia oblita]|uniref:43 kDa receptor-associated protein of the synapse n=1 Tax=Holotrichia oblita TaxID=644536 RepID=A0ACB9SNH4_HOLOL|nr:43 kda receptor-associated protein of the synapse [Holotrichia oblita]